MKSEVEGAAAAATMLVLGQPLPDAHRGSAQLLTIEWNMMDKSRFIPLSMLSSFSVRCLLYPLTLVKTRIQVQKRNGSSEEYRGLVDACCRIYREEGAKGLYRGFWVGAFQIVSGVGYIATYESVRHALSLGGVEDGRLKALAGGGCASLVGQTIVVPSDVVSQHLMMLRTRKNSGAAKSSTRHWPGGERRGERFGGISATGAPEENWGGRGGSVDASRSAQKSYQKHGGLSIETEGRSRFQITVDIVKQIYRQDGLKGFYRGYGASLCTYVPNSALWWSFYHLYQDELSMLLPPWVSHLLIQCVSGTLGGFTTTLITNPIDIVRARLQVQRLDSMGQTFRILWSEEGMRMFSKGLSARLVQSAVFSSSIILAYESIKRFSVKDEYRHLITW
ncbi:solute carrier family 25 member 44 [Ischnura elegans]|uniref:solute carrier family 25 member 44 n=1 Tax=Ischnura elegans TaxID=197161 RepID=UPI001ED87139|nr:solute carrier family 25 member 44 [Ischnura elegans]XP_046397422.1 solute carrier family 25 member 44 [Ischnura elegans]